jgi:GTPase SAR1 family protein
MKIAFIGTHGVGKTTLAYELCNELKKQHLDVGFIEMNKIYPNIICDRSVLDNYVYLYHKFGHIAELHGLSKYWVRTYDLLFKVPFTRKYLRPDGVRSVDFEFQETIDEKLVQLLREDEVPYHDHKVMSDTVQIILDYHRTHIGPLQRRIPGI